MFPPQTLISVHEWFGTEFSTANFCRQPSWVDRLIKPDIVMGFLMLETIQHTTKLFLTFGTFFQWARSLEKVPSNKDVFDFFITE